MADVPADHHDHCDHHDHRDDLGDRDHRDDRNDRDDLGDRLAALDPSHLADSAFWDADPEHRHAVFAALREAPVRWFAPRRSDFSRPCSGFWALTRHADVWRASRDASVFRSGFGIDIEETPPELQGYLSSMITMDDPEHHRLRTIVAKGFSPRHVTALDGRLRAIASEIVDDIVERFGDGAEFDAVANLSARLPLRAIGELMGIPEDEQPLVFAWTNAVVAPDDPAVGVDGARAANAAMAAYATELGAARRARPRDDLTSALMDAEVDGARLTTEEFANFFILLVSAGNETTRNAISHGLRLLTSHPDQRRAWFADFDGIAPTAVDEIVRYETPITNMARVTVQDVEFDGVRIPAGSKVALWYTSANRDAAVFADPDRFDVRRPLRPQHVAYGGGGPHFCLGANLARREIAVMFDEIRRRIPTIEVTGAPVRVRTMGLNAIAAMPAAIA